MEWYTIMCYNDSVEIWAERGLQVSFFIALAGIG